MNDAQTIQQVRDRRPHVYELDPIRAATALCVIGVHVAALSDFLDTTPSALAIQNGFVTALHFTREVFMFVTAFALIYVYYGKQFRWANFWKKRSIGVLFPYVLWSVIYVWLNVHPQTPWAFIGTSVQDIATGNASYQLYYILLTLQLYVILPFFMAFLRWANKRPWKTLAVCFILELVITWADHTFIESAPQGRADLIGNLNLFINRCVLTYEFYFVLGGLAALNLKTLRGWLAQHARLSVGVGIAAVVVLEGHYAYSLLTGGTALSYAIEVLEPIMVPYCVAIIITLCWLTFTWARHLQANGKPAHVHFWTTLSDASFGIYLCHPIFLALVLAYVVPAVRGVLPTIVLVPLIWLITAGCATVLTIALMKTPILSRTVGRSTKTVLFPHRGAKQSADRAQVQEVA